MQRRLLFVFATLDEIASQYESKLNLSRTISFSGCGLKQCRRLLVGMQRLSKEDLRGASSIFKSEEALDNQTAIRLKKKLAEEFRDQLTLGIPTNHDEARLRRLAAQIRATKVVVKLYLRHPLHAKLYLLFRPDPISMVSAVDQLRATFASESLADMLPKGKTVKAPARGAAAKRSAAKNR